jgi:hypothetical protein
LADQNLSSGWKSWLGQTFDLQILSFDTGGSRGLIGGKLPVVSPMLESRQLAKTSVTGYWQARNSGSARVLLSADNSPLAAESESSILWLFDIGSTKSRFFLDSSFPVFAFRCLQYLANSRFESEQLMVGQVLSADEIILPGGEKTELNGSSFKTFEPGIYTLNWRGSSPQNLAIGLDPAESGFTPADYNKNNTFQILGKRWQEQLFLSRLGHDIWKYLLLAALVLLILELVLVKSEEWKKGSVQT